MLTDYAPEDPNYLYKYCTFDNYSLQAIANGHFWYSKLQEFNDPFEAKPLMNNVLIEHIDNMLYQTGIVNLDSVNVAHMDNEYLYEREHHDISAISEKASTFLYKKVSNIYRQADKYGVLCLSSNPSSVLMWSHYADNHKGIVIQLERSGGSELRNSDKTFKVEYSDKYPNSEFSNVVGNSSERDLKQLILARKGDYWSYEEEWRVIENNGNKIYDRPGQITGVIFGLRTSFSQKAAIMKLCINSGINMFDARRVNNMYSINIVPCKTGS